MTKEQEAQYNELVGELIHTAMWKKKLTQTDVAERLGINQSTLSRKIRGYRPIEIGELARIAAVLDVPIGDLVPNVELVAMADSLTQYYLTVKSGRPDLRKRRSERPSLDLLRRGHRLASV